MTPKLTAFIKNNKDRAVLYRHIRKCYNDAAVLPSARVQSGVRTVEGESPPLTKGQAILSVLLAIDADYQQGALAREFEVSERTITNWKQGNPVRERSQEFALSYAQALLGEFKKIIDPLKQANDKESYDISPKDLLDVEGLDKLLEELEQLRSLLLRGFIITLIEGLQDAKFGDYFYSLGCVTGVTIYPISQYDKDSLLVLRMKILAFEDDYPELETGIPVNFLSLTDSIRSEIEDKLERAQAGE